MSLKILAYELRPGMTVLQDGKPDFRVGVPFALIGSSQVAFRDAVDSSRIGVWPRLAVVEVATS